MKVGSSDVNQLRYDYVRHKLAVANLAVKLDSCVEKNKITEEYTNGRKV